MNRHLRRVIPRATQQLRDSFKYQNVSRIPEDQLLTHSSYPGELPSTRIPVQASEINENLGRKVLNWFYKNYKELYNRHRNLVPFGDSVPHVHEKAWVAPSATIIGDVKLDPSANVWYGAVLRGDMNEIQVGAYTNIQDGVIITTDSKRNIVGQPSSVIIGDRVTIGHGARLHACTINENTLIGMNATILEGATVEEDCIVAAGSVVPPGRRIPAGQMWAGSPARYIRDIGVKEREAFEVGALQYAELAELHANEFKTTPLEMHQEVEQLVETIESKIPEEALQYDDRPVHWNVWRDMKKPGYEHNE